MEHNNPTAFWKLINKIKGKVPDHNTIEPEVLFKYFQELHSPKNNIKFEKNFEIKMKEHLERQNYDHWVKHLDRQISEKEVIETVKSTKKQ